MDEISTRLDIQIKPFQITKRQVLIDRLVYDAKVIEAVQQEAARRDCPREIVQSEVLAYAKEIVPSFNAYLYFRFGYWLSKRIAKLLYRVQIWPQKRRRCPTPWGSGPRSGRCKP